MLIEDCEDEGFEDILPDLKKIHDSGKEILKIIEESLSDSNVELSGEKISEIGRKMEISLRTPINTVIGYSEMLQEDADDIELDTFSEDLDKIIKSGKALTSEIDKVISFNPINLLKKDQSLGAIKSVLTSIQPLTKDEETKSVTGSILVVDDNKNNTTLLKKRLQKIGNNVAIANDGIEALIELMIMNLI